LNAKEPNVNLELWILLRLLVAALLGGVVGYERTATGKRAGLRTHMLVAIGSALFMSTADLALDWAHQANFRHQLTNRDLPSILQVQVAVLSPVQAVATGIGFLGAGTIFLGGHRQRVHGLTTAASIWVIAAVGIAVGCDRFLLATGASLLMLLILHVLIKLEPPRSAEDAHEEPKGP
jgi:putative Mg2+ transporter-C (MgtC) family protein